MKNIEKIVEEMMDAVQRNDQEAGAAVLGVIGVGLLQDVERVASALEKIASLMEQDQIVVNTDVGVADPDEYRSLRGD